MNLKVGDRVRWKPGELTVSHRKSLEYHGSLSRCGTIERIEHIDGGDGVWIMWDGNKSAQFRFPGDALEIVEEVRK